MGGLPVRLELAVGATIAAAIVLGTALWFLGDALTLRLEAGGFAPAASAGLTGLAGLALSGLLAILARRALRSPRPALATRPAANDIAADLGALAGQQIAAAAREHPYGTTGAALAAGVALGALPELRKALTGLLGG